MARVWYVGTYPYREITTHDWDDLGVFGPHFQWSSNNGWSIDQEEFRPEHLAYLASDPEFLLDQEGVRPDTPMPPDDVTRPYKADASILKLVDDAFDALDLANAALTNVDQSEAAAADSAQAASDAKDHIIADHTHIHLDVQHADTHAQAAAGSASIATQKASDASGSASAAAGSATAAGQAKADALTYRNTAQSAAGTATTQAGIATARAGEAATSAQTATDKATQASNSALTLSQRIAGGAREISYTSDGKPYLIPESEVSEVQLRVDTTVGTRVFLGDQMIYGDTGWRSVPLMENWTGVCRIRRMGSFIEARLEDVHRIDPSISGSNAVYLPAGFRLTNPASLPSTNQVPLVNSNSAGGDSYAYIAANGVYLRVVNTSDDPGNAVFFFTVDQDWPASLPGTPA